MKIKNEITVILTVWKRNNLVEQIRHIINQSKRPYQIWIYQNESHVDIQIPKDIKEEYNISHIHSKDTNFKFHGRFALPLLCDTEYIAIFDDDTMPGVKWLENCLDTSKRNNCIVGANGRTMKEGFENSSGQHMLAYGDGKPVEREMEVDFVGHCWFFKSEWCRNLWKDKPYSWDNGEDIHFAASCQIYEKIKCFIPKMPMNDRGLWGDTKPHLGSDHHASWRKGSHAKLRSEVVNFWYKKGWKPLITRE